MLAVVDHQEAGAVAEDGDAGRQDVALDDVEVQGRRERVRECGRVGDRREQQHDVRPVGRGDLQGHPGLADPTCPDDA